MVNKQRRKGTDWENTFVHLIEDNVKNSIVKRIATSGAIGTALEEPLLQGDVVAKFTGFPKKFRFECKTGYGGSKQLAVKKEWLDKISEEAKNANSYPAVACKFTGAKQGTKYFIILDIDTFCDIINYVNNIKLLYDREVDSCK